MLRLSSKVNINLALKDVNKSGLWVTVKHLKTSEKSYNLKANFSLILVVLLDILHFILFIALISLRYIKKIPFTLYVATQTKKAAFAVFRAAMNQFGTIQFSPLLQKCIL